jgi:hypothetical protein
MKFSPVVQLLACSHAMMALLGCLLLALLACSHARKLLCCSAQKSIID